MFAGNKVPIIIFDSNQEKLTLSFLVHYQNNRRERINIQIQEKNIKYVRTAQNLSNYNDDDVVIRPTVKNFGAVDLFVMPDYVFQITVFKKHPIKQKELVKIIPNMLAYKRDSNAIIRLVFVV